MNSKIQTRVIAITLSAFTVPVIFGAQNIAAQNKHNSIQDRQTKHHHYQLVQIPTLGGVQTNFFDSANNVGVLNNRGAVSGGSSDTLLPDPYSSSYWWEPDGSVTHGFIWQNSSLTDLGSLPGNNNSAATWISANGTVAGYSENGQIDPSVPDLPEFSAVMWRDGKITDLGSLPGGGYESSAVSVNRHGEVAGVATNLVPDANSLAFYLSDLWFYVPYGYQTRAFVWNRKSGMQDLGTLGTGTNAQAIAINERGQVIGDSYTSSAPGACNAWGQGPLTTGAFIWDKDHGMVDLGGFGGTCTMAQGLNNGGQIVGQSNVAGDSYARAFLWQNGSLHDLGGSLGGNGTAAVVINERGDVAGTASLPGEATFHAVLWRRSGKMTDLGTVGTDPCSIAHGLNEKGQVVGDSTPNDCVQFDTSRPFLWEKGSMADLNTLIPTNSPLSLVWAYSINERGEIAVNGFDVNGFEQGALLIPCDGNHPAIEGCDYSLVDAATAIMSAAPASVAALPMQRTIRTRPAGILSRFARAPRTPASSASIELGDGNLPEICTRCCGQCALLALTPPSLDFAAQPVGTKSAPQTAILTNRGNKSGSVPSISTAGPFSQTNNCPGVLRAHASCQIQVQFVPQTKGVANGALSVGALQTILSGVGQ